MRGPAWSKIVRGKRHEMFKSRLHSRHWSCRLPERLVRQATLLFTTLSQCVCGRRMESKAKPEERAAQALCSRISCICRTDPTNYLHNGGSGGAACTSGYAI